MYRRSTDSACIPRAPDNTTSPSRRHRWLAAHGCQCRLSLFPRALVASQELSRPAYSCNGGSPSKILSAQQSLSSFPESDGMHTDGTPRQRAGFARGSISPAHVCGIWSLRSPGSPRGSLAITHEIESARATGSTLNQRGIEIVSNKRAI